jgi:uncharacterized RDD family membrane protein YckC
MIVHEVITAEKVPFTYRVAGLGARFLAWSVDILLIGLLGFVGAMFGSVMEGLRPGLGAAVVALWLFALMWGYFLCFEWLWSGQTPGKRLLGIRVIHERGTSISFFHAAVRNVLRVVDSLPWFLFLGLYGIGFGIALCHPKQRRLGDWAAGTLVVHVERKARPIQTVYQGDEESKRREMQVRQRLVQLNRDQKQTLLDLCLRRDQLRLSDRAQLFHAVAEYLRTQLHLMPEEHQSDEKFILQLAGILGSSLRDGGAPA